MHACMHTLHARLHSTYVPYVHSLYLPTVSIYVAIFQIKLHQIDGARTECIDGMNFVVLKRIGLRVCAHYIIHSVTFSAALN